MWIQNVEMFLLNKDIIFLNSRQQLRAVLDIICHWFTAVSITIFLLKFYFFYLFGYERCSVQCAGKNTVRDESFSCVGYTIDFNINRMQSSSLKSFVCKIRNSLLEQITFEGKPLISFWAKIDRKKTSISYVW